jgi:alpha-galactosidase/6-phospho-beta-glucosidase family protein
VDAFSLEATIAHGDAIWEEMREQAFSDRPLGDEFFGRFSGEHEQVVEIIDSIRSDAKKLYSANLPNTGQAPNLPPDAVIECPAIAGKDGLRPIQMPALDPGLAATLARPFAWVETVVDAALERSRDKFVQALVVDGSVSSLDMAERLADELIAAQREYLPGLPDQ